MWPYWIMFLLPSATACFEAHPDLSALTKKIYGRRSIEWWLAWAILILVIGFRHEVGGDWFNYLRNFEYDRGESLWEALTDHDPGYHLLEWFSVQLGWGIYGVNFLAAIAFSSGLVVFCRHLPRPWLALAVAVPYVVIVLGMGYSRQGVALGFIMLGLVALGKQRIATFVACGLLGATFHSSAILLLPMAALAASRRKVITVIWVGVVVASAYVVLLQDAVDNLQLNYLAAQQQSQGALVRLLLNALPAALLLIWRKRLLNGAPQQRVWIWFAVAALGLLGLYFVSPSSTAVDRVALYILPLQMMVFSHAPESFGRRKGSNKLTVGLIIVLYGAIQFVWLNYAVNSYLWLPYRFYPME